MGYFISDTKSNIVPTKRLIHLGFGIDNSDGSFFIPDKLRGKFRKGRDALLLGSATLHQMQSFIGKCNHLRLLFNATSLFTLECRKLLPVLDEVPRQLPLGVLDEVRHGTFVDSFTSPIPFRRQQHLSFTMSSDASEFAWGAYMDLPSGPASIRDYWEARHMPKDIAVKEALAILLALESMADALWDRRVDVFCDNEALVLAWAGLKASSRDLVKVLKSLFAMCCEFNVLLKLHWIPSAANPADGPSRHLSRADSALGKKLRDLIWSLFGPFSIDLMALGSNAFRKPSGERIPFFSPCPMPGSSGCNVFAQRRPEGVAYVFPPFVMISAVINLLREWGSVRAVLVLPWSNDSQRPWMQLLLPYIISQRLLSSDQDVGVLDIPSSSGYQANRLPLGFGLMAFMCSFPASPLPAPLPHRNVKVLLVSDSVFRPLERFEWPLPFSVSALFTRWPFVQSSV